MARTTIASVIGGTAAELGGGKFANGAVSGAFVHMFNAEAKYLSKKELDYSATRALGEEKQRIDKLDVDSFNRQMGTSISKADLSVAKMHLYRQMDEYLVNGVASVLPNAASVLYTPNYSYSVPKAIGWLYDVVGSQMTYGFRYDCGVTRCSFRGMFIVK